MRIIGFNSVIKSFAMYREFVLPVASLYLRWGTDRIYHTVYSKLFLVAEERVSTETVYERVVE